MRSRPRIAAAAAGLLAVVLALPATPAASATPPSSALTRTQLDAALARLRQDPDLGGDRHVRVLRWVQRRPAQPAQPSPYLKRLLEWIGGALRWLGRAGRIVVLGALAVLAGLLAMYLVRALGQRRARALPALPEPPQFVRGLDIRPVSLPADIGAAALALWRRGEYRAALALLYRGVLSRAVHVHGVPIRDSSTEGECLSLAARGLPPAALQYAARLVTVWQRAVYGGTLPGDDAVASLCERFDAALGPAPASGAGEAADPAPGVPAA